MKTLILMRHGQAEPYADTDAQRPLTPAGHKKVLTSAYALQKEGHLPSLLLCSPLLRALQSAQLVGETLGLSAQTEERLDGRCSAQELIDFAHAQLQKTDCIMLVGHNPNISLAASILRKEYTPFAAGGYAIFDLTDATRPKLLKLEA